MGFSPMRACSSMMAGKADSQAMCGLARFHSRISPVFHTNTVLIHLPSTQKERDGLKCGSSAFLQSNTIIQSEQRKGKAIITCSLYYTTGGVKEMKGLEHRHSSGITQRTYYYETVLYYSIISLFDWPLELNTFYLNLSNSKPSCP